jgi:transposase
VPVRTPGTGRTKTARLWTYVRDDRAAADDAPAAVWFAYSEDRKGEHPKQHLSSFSGILQADGYAGFHHLYEGARIAEAACFWGDTAQMTDALTIGFLPRKKVNTG